MTDISVYVCFINFVIFMSTSGDFRFEDVNLVYNVNYNLLKCR